MDDTRTTIEMGRPRTSSTKKETRIVANVLWDVADSYFQRLSGHEELASNREFVETVIKLYSASGELFKRGNFSRDAKNMFEWVNKLKADYKR